MSAKQGVSGVLGRLFERVEAGAAAPASGALPRADLQPDLLPGAQAGSLPDSLPGALAGSPPDSLAGSPPGSLSPRPAKGVARAKLWSLDRKFHCLIVGTCISAGDLTRIGRRFHFGAAPNDDYGNHVEAVGWCGTRNDVSEALQRHLDKRYAEALQAFSSARNESAILVRWNERLACGDVAGPLWAAVTHKHAGEEVRRTAYAAVHMLSHQVGAGVAADLRRLETLARDNDRLRAEQGALRATLAHRAAISGDEHRALKRELATLRGENAALAKDRAKLAELENGVTMIRFASRLLALRDENLALQAAAARAASLAARVEALTRERDAARADNGRLHAERALLERLLPDSAAMAEVDASSAPDESATACANAGDCLRCAEENGLSRARCILCVGGRTSLLSHYRALAARLGIRLIHHDGGQEEALSRLPELIASADAVLCPTDCVGHAAYYSLKQHCRKSGKPCLLFKGAGVTSFAFALSRLSAGESTLAVGESSSALGESTPAAGARAIPTRPAPAATR